MDDLGIPGVSLDKKRELTEQEKAEEEALQEIRRNVVAQEITNIQQIASEREQILDSIKFKIKNFEPFNIDPDWYHHEGLVEEIQVLQADDWLTQNLRRKIMLNEEDDDPLFF